MLQQAIKIIFQELVLQLDCSRNQKICAATWLFLQGRIFSTTRLFVILWDLGCNKDVCATKRFVLQQDCLLPKDLFCNKALCAITALLLHQGYLCYQSNCAPTRPFVVPKVWCNKTVCATKIVMQQGYFCYQSIFAARNVLAITTFMLKYRLLVLSKYLCCNTTLLGSKGLVLQQGCLGCHRILVRQHYLFNWGNCAIKLVLPKGYRFVKLWPNYSWGLTLRDLLKYDDILLHIDWSVVVLQLLGLKCRYWSLKELDIADAINMRLL